MSKIRAWAKNAWSYMGIDDLFAVLFAGLGVLGFADWITSIPGGKIIFDLRAELIGIGITVFIIGNATEARERTNSRKFEKKRMILQMGSPDNAFAREAVRYLGSRGWLHDGSLRAAYLSGASLYTADLYGADLYGAELSEVDLSLAKLSMANLSGANLTEAILEVLYDERTQWPDGFDPEAAGAMREQY